MNERELIIRDAVESDAVAINSLLVQLGYADIGVETTTRKILDHRRPGYLLLVGEWQGNVIAFIALHWYDLLHYHKKAGRITSFCVDENHRSHGFGLALLTQAERFLFAQGCVRVEVTSNLRRTRAQAFYLDNGYQEVSRHFVKKRQ